MITALLADKSVRACDCKSGDRAICKGCGGEVVARVGEVNVAHFAHLNLVECEYGSGETEWHRQLKEYFGNLPGFEVEVPLIKNDKKKIADVMTSSGFVIELQNSSISMTEVREREQFYEDMLWIFNGEDFWKNIVMKRHYGGDDFSFRWKWPHRDLLEHTKPLYIMKGFDADNVMHIKTLHQSNSTYRSYDSTRVNGSLRFMHLEDIINQLPKVKKFPQKTNQKNGLTDEEFIEMHKQCKNDEERESLPFHRRVEYIKFKEGREILVITSPNWLSRLNQGAQTI